jgi:hypothetical protein
VTYLALPAISTAPEFGSDPTAWMLATGNAVAPTERWVWMDPGLFQGSLEQGAELFLAPSWLEVDFGFPGHSLIDTSNSRSTWPQLKPSFWLGSPATL